MSNVNSLISIRYFYLAFKKNDKSQPEESVFMKLYHILLQILK